MGCSCRSRRNMGVAMTDEEAMEIVLEAAEKRADYHPQRDEILKAVSQIRDYATLSMHEDLTREEFEGDVGRAGL